MFKKAILIIHGFAGGTYDEEPLANFLELNYSFDVFTFTLPGHEYVANMNAKYSEWISYSEKQVEYLINNGYNSIYLIGHSMGGVIATYLATKYSQIKKLVLVAPAFKYFYDENDGLISILKKGKLLFKDYGYETIVNRFIKASISSVNEFTKLIKQYYNTPSLITIPTLIVQGLDDRIVPKKSAEYIYSNLKGVKQLLYVKNVNHDVFRGKNVNVINKEIEYFLKKIILIDKINEL